MDFHLYLFGLKLAVRAGQEVQHKVVDPAATIHVRLAADRATVRIWFADPVPGGRLEFDTTFACTADGDELVLAPPTAPANAAVRYTFPLGLSADEFSFTAQVAAAPREWRLGVLFVHTQRFQYTLFEIPLNARFNNLFFRNPASWSSPPAMSFQLDGGVDKSVGPHALILTPPDELAKPKYQGIRVGDGLESLSGGVSLGRRQDLAVARVELGRNRVLVRARPALHGLFVHADVLDTHNASAEGNRLVHQQVLVNGELVADCTRPAGSLSVDLRWDARRDEPSLRPAVLVYRLMDESGLPLLLEGSSFPLQQRRGISTDSKTFKPGDPRMEQTIQGLVVHGDRTVDGLTLRSIDPLRVNLAEMDGDAWWRDLEKKDRVPFSAHAPVEIHGLAQGVYLSRTGDDAPVGCTLAMKTIRKADIGTIYTLPEVVLDAPTGAGRWQLWAQAEERELHPSAEKAEVGMRMAAAAATAVRLPTFDTSIAFANLADEAGRVSAGVLLDDGVRWVKELDTALSETFSSVALAPQVHLEGFGVQPPAAQGVAAILDLPPGRVESVAATAQTGLVLRPDAVRYSYGGKRQADKALWDAAAEDVEGFDWVAKAFARLWFAGWASTAAVVEARRKLREYLGEARSLTGLDDKTLGEYAKQAREVVEGARRIEGFTEAYLAELRTALDNVSEAKFRELWESGANHAVSALFDALWAPAYKGIARRALDAIYNKESTLPSDVRETLKKALELPADWSTGKWNLEEFVRKRISRGVPLQAALGIDSVMQDAEELWRDDARLAGLRRKYGAALSLDVIQRLLKSEADLWTVFLVLAARTTAPIREQLIGELAGVWKTSPALADLREAYRKFGTELAQVYDELRKNEEHLRRVARALSERFPATFFARLRTEPPEYLFVSARVPLRPSADAKHYLDLWNHAFRLCELPSGSWDFFLDGDSAAIVKLTGERDVADVIREVHASYRSPALPLPLGIEPDELVRKLDSAMRHPSWRGVVFVRPMADLRGDPQLQSVAGLSQIAVDYAAVGGATPKSDKVDVDVFAHISQRAAPVEAAKDLAGDVGLSLTSFNATIRNTRLVAGEVTAELRIRDLWGKDTGDRPTSRILLRGTLPPAGAGGEPRGLEFAAWLPEPAEVPVELGFVDRFVFRGMRVVSTEGKTSLDIDADLRLRTATLPVGTEPPIGGVEPSVGGGDGGSVLKLKNFRIRLPVLGGGRGIRMGVARLLDFEFPSLSIDIPKPRSMRLLGGIELKPFGLGYVRAGKNNGEALKALRGAYQWLNGDVFPDELRHFPYLKATLDFGKLPRFGGLQLSSLKLDVVVGLPIEKGGDGTPKGLAIGIAGLDAREISFDLFGLLKLSVEQLFLGEVKTVGRDASIILADNAHLSILGWSPIPEASRLKILFGQRAPADAGQPTETGVLLSYARLKEDDGEDEEEEEKKKAFLQIAWMLLAHNWVLPNDLLNALLGGAGNPATLLDALVARDADGRPVRVNADLGDAGWLFGLGFRLGEFIDRGALILHDQHYYGISLQGPVVKALIGEDLLELAYMPGPTRREDRFRTSFRIPVLDLIAGMTSGVIGIEWSPSWDYQLDFGFPWKSGAAYQWERSFSVPVGTYEAKFGFYFEKRNFVTPTGARQLVLGAGVGLYVGYRVGFGKPGKGVWAQAGIGVFGVLEGRITFEMEQSLTDGSLAGLRARIVSIEVTGVIGIYAYGEGGIEVWVLSARFRVSAQAALSARLRYLPGGTSTLSYAATLSARYSASVRVGRGIFKFTFRVSGSIDVEVRGQLLLS